MHINLILVPFIIIMGLLFAQNDTRWSRRNYIILCSAVLIFVAAMRSPSWMTTTYGIDTLVYKNWFEETLAMEWDELLSIAYQRYFLHDTEGDIGFLILSKSIGYITQDFAFFSLIADLIFFAPFGVILYRYSTSVTGIIFAYVFYVSLIQLFLIAGARQMFAIGFDMLAMLAVIDKKNVRASVFFVVGVTIHLSSFMFIFPLIMMYCKIKPQILKKIHYYSLILLPVFFVFSKQIIYNMGSLTGMEKYSNYGMGDVIGAITFVLLIELMSVFCYFAITRKKMERNDSLMNFYVMAPFFTVFGLMSNGTMIRLSLYFHIFLSILFPLAIDCYFKGNEKKIAYFFTISSLAFLTAMNGGFEYYFFWQI